MVPSLLGKQRTPHQARESSNQPRFCGDLLEFTLRLENPGPLVAERGLAALHLSVHFSPGSQRVLKAPTDTTFWT